MSWKIFFSVFSVIFLLGLIFMYWFILPIGTESFGRYNQNTNFSLDSNQSLQFYPNLRYPAKEISYRIENCPLAKHDEIIRSLQTLKNLTILNFYSVKNNEEIQITCDSNTKLEGDFFVAGEGGPEIITETSNFNVILRGKVLLLRESKCENPIIGVHEILHALGFVHSANPYNIMYNFSKCGQEIGQDVINEINRLYSVESLPDLVIESASAQMSGRYLDVNATVRNNGLKEVENANLIIYEDNSKVKEISLNKLKIGYGSTFAISNIFVPDLRVNEIKLLIEYPDPELDKLNNEIVLTLEKN